jgi:hypothetical protein
MPNGCTRFATPAGRQRNRSDLDMPLEPVSMTQTPLQWRRRLGGAGVMAPAGETAPAGPMAGGAPTGPVADGAMARWRDGAGACSFCDAFVDL